MPERVTKTAGIASKRKESEKENKDRVFKLKKTVTEKTNSKKQEIQKKKISKEADRKGPLKEVKANDSKSKVEESVINGSRVERRTGKIYLGYHASSAGGVHNAVINCVEVGAQSVALFLRSQRQWSAPPLKQEVVEQFRELTATHEIQKHLILPHGSYLINLGSPDGDQREKSVDALVDDLRRCDQLGISLYNIHPGSSCGKISREECISNIAQGINTAHQMTSESEVMIVLENMSCQGHTIGGDLSEIKEIIDQVEDKTRVGVCLDTCHAMAAGYDLSKQEGFNKLLSDFQTKIGWEWLVGCHINDSKGPAGNHRDRHENIGKGSIGVEGFRRIVNCPHFTDIPLILETPLDQSVGNKGYQEEINLLMSLIDKKLTSV